MRKIILKAKGIKVLGDLKQWEDSVKTSNAENGDHKTKTVTT